MAAGEADVLQIVVLAAGAHALLRSGGAVVVAALHAEKYVFELVHARVGEQQGGVVRRNQRGGVHAAVPLLLEELQEHLTNLVAGTDLHTISSLHLPPMAGACLARALS